MSRRLGTVGLGCLLLALLVASSGALASALSDLRRHQNERRWLEAEARGIVGDLQEDRARVVAVMKAVRGRLMPGDQPVPWLRATAAATWRSREGYCGDAARVMVLMLQSLGIPAARLYLRNDPSYYFHIAVAYKEGTRWHVADTVQSEAALFAFLLETTTPLDALVTDNPFFSSYSFMNWGLVVPFVRVDQRSPFPQPVSTLMESPYLVTASSKTAVALSLLAATVVVGVAGTRQAGRRETGERAGDRLTDRA